jgi:ketol-acid reductoisomerase
MKIKALVPFSTGTITMEQYEVKEVTDTIGEQLVDAGVAVEIGGGSGGGGVLVVTDTNGTLDKTWQEIHDAGAAIICLSNDAAQSKTWYSVTEVVGESAYLVFACLPGINGKTGEPENDFRRYAVDSADAYPILE